MQRILFMDKKDAEQLADALQLAAVYHRNQRRDNGEPYFMHIMRVVMGVNGRDKIVAALHDIVEDGHLAAIELRHDYEFDEDIVEAVELLTHEEGVTYQEYVERLADNPMARRVKLADLEDNMQVFRIGKFTDKRMDKMGKYVKARDYLLSIRPRGDYNEGWSMGYNEGYESALADSTGNP
jgi:(p)ppGpp synthase/HD superfamily hydrolase